MATFIASFDPPDDDRPGRWFVVGEGAVAVIDTPLPSDAAHFLGLLDREPCWAVDLEEVAGSGGLDVAAAAVPEPLRSLYGRLDEVEWTVAGRAVQLVDWARTHRYCGRCGTATVPARGER